MPAASADHTLERVILVVDDEDAVRRVITRTMTEAGFRVRAAAGAREALSLLETLGPLVVWLVLSDILMPGMNGLELAETIARKWPAVLVVLISASAPNVDFSGSFLQKPFKPDVLVSLVTSLLPTPSVTISDTMASGSSGKHKTPPAINGGGV